MNQEQITQIGKAAQAARRKGKMLVIYPSPILDLVHKVEQLQAEVERLKSQISLSGVAETMKKYVAEVERLEAEVERLKLYTDQKLFAAAYNVIDAWDDYSQTNMPLFIEAMDESLAARLSEAVAWWDSLPFDPEKDVEKLPKYEG